jgi:biofilm PGA synthesis N-glycosyltransferase PgaC
MAPVNSPARSPRILVVSPFHNEEAFVERVCEGMASQTLPPAEWIAVDDGSTDGTLQALRVAAMTFPEMNVLARTREVQDLTTRDPLAGGAAVRATNWGLGHADLANFDFIAKIDGDVVLGPHFFQDVVREFRTDRALGICGGRLLESIGGNLKMIPIPEHHVHGALKVYSQLCLSAIGGLEPRLGWDAIDETYARLRGFRTYSPSSITALHLRPWASANGVLRGRARHGACAYITHYPLYWALLRSVKLGLARPRVLSGAAFAYGYMRAWAAGAPRVDDQQFREFARAELRRRVTRRAIQ